MIGAPGLIAESPVSIPTFSAPKISTRSKNFSLTSAFSGAVYTDRWPRASATAWAATAIIDLPEPVGVEAMTWESVTISHSASSWCGYSSRPRLSAHVVNESIRSSSDGCEFGAGKAVIASQSALDLRRGDIYSLLADRSLPKADGGLKLLDHARNNSARGKRSSEFRGPRFLFALGPGNECRKFRGPPRLEVRPQAGCVPAVGGPRAAQDAHDSRRREQRLPGNATRRRGAGTPPRKRVPDVAVEAARGASVAEERSSGAQNVPAGERQAIVPEEDTVSVRLVVVAEKIAARALADLHAAAQVREPRR